MEKPMSPAMKFIISRILPIVFILIGLCVGYFGIRGLIRAKESLKWPNSKGKIISSVVERKKSSGTRKSGGSSVTYSAEILYEFSVAGTVFNGTRIAYGDYSSSNSSHARKIVNKYPKGKQIKVYYMPEDPEVSLLEPGVQLQAYFLPSFGLVFFLIGSIMAIAMKKLKNTEQKRVI